MKKHIRVSIFLAVLVVVFNTGCSTKVGDIITFGHYEQDNDTSNGKEPIKWRVLDIDSNGHLLIISDKVLDNQQYNTTEGPIFWEKSTIRSWLNGYGSSRNTVGTDYRNNNFIDTAFTPKEKARIITSTVPAHKNPRYSWVPAGYETSDKIFLLSVVEAEKYFTTDEARQAYATLYAVNNGLETYNDNTKLYCAVIGFQMNKCLPSWLLRSSGGAPQGYDPNSSAAVCRKGGTGCAHIAGSGDSGGVRPALWLNW